MRYRLFIFLLTLSLSACSFNVDVGIPLSTPALSLTAFPAETPSPIPFSTSTPNVTSTPLQEEAGVYPIRFAPDGTYMDVVDSILAGASKTYSIDASKGQIMSVSVRLGAYSNWTVIPMKIVGADGNILCPTQENMACYFWRGTLPATQNYFVTLSPDIDVSGFTMRVSANPPGAATQSFSYVSSNEAATLFYSDEFAPVLFPEMYVSKLTPDLTLQFIDTESLDNTNLIEAYFLFGFSNDPGIVTGCTQPGSFGGEENITAEVNIGGIPFTRGESVGVGAGNYYEQTYYRTVYQGSCYEITFMIHSANIGNYAPDSGIREFDRNGLTQKFEAILSTLVIK